MADLLKDDDSTPQAPKAAELTSKVLDFLSSASNETLCACALGMGAITYFILGRVGLVLIGAGAGVVLHATWTEHGRGSYEFNESEKKRRKEIGLDIVRRLLDWQDTKSLSIEQNGTEKQTIDGILSEHKELDFSDFQPETSAALTSLVDAVIRDYVKYRLSQRIVIVRLTLL